MSIDWNIDGMNQTPFASVDNDFKEQNLIEDGLRFLASITEYYGAEDGLNVWNSICESVDQDIKGKIFFRMITGETMSSHVVFTTPPNTGQAVPIIKCIRTYTGYGLKDAKDAYDRSIANPEQLNNVKPDNKRDFVRELRSLGCRVL